MCWGEEKCLELGTVADTGNGAEIKFLLLWALILLDKEERARGHLTNKESCKTHQRRVLTQAPQAELTTTVTESRKQNLQLALSFHVNSFLLGNHFVLFPRHCKEIPRDSWRNHWKGRICCLWTWRGILLIVLFKFNFYFWMFLVVLSYLLRF